MSVTDHKKEAPNSVKVMVITVSDTRDTVTDRSGQKIMELLRLAGHKVVQYQIVKDEQAKIKKALIDGCENPNVDVILTNGGTGISARDVTIETIVSMIDKEMPGYGELFRMLSYQEDIGAAAILSRAVAGVANGTAIFAMPGSTGAVTLAMNKLIVPEITHVIREIRKDQSK